MEYAYDFWMPPAWAVRWLAAVVLLCWVVLLAGLSPWTPRRTGLAVGLGVLMGLLGLSLPPEMVDPGWLHNLQEGTQLDVVRSARGENGHSGLMQTSVATLWMGAERWLPGLVPLHLGMTLFLGVALCVLSAALAGPEVAIGVGLAWVGALTVRLGVLGEGAGPMASWWTLVLLSSAVAWRRTPWAAVVMVGAGGLLVLTRTDLSWLVLAVFGATALDGRPWVDRVRERPLVERAAWALALVVLIHAVMVRLPVEGLRWSWLTAATHPLESSPTVLPSMLLATWPPGVALLTLAGLAWSLWHPVRSVGVGVAFLGLHKLYFVAGHGGGEPGVSATELFRYHTHLAVLVVVLAVLGWRWLGPRRRGLQILAGLACLVPPVPMVMAHTPGVHWGAGWSLTGVHGDTQQDGRALVQAMARASTCGFVVRDTPPSSGGQGGWLAWLGPEAAGSVPTAIPGVGDHIRLVEHPASRSPLAVANTLQADCVLVYEGLGCRVEGREGCGSPEGEVLWEEALAAPAYTHPAHGLTPSPGTLRVWRVR